MYEALTAAAGHSALAGSHPTTGQQQCSSGITYSIAASLKKFVLASDPTHNGRDTALDKAAVCRLQE